MSDAPGPSCHPIYSGRQTCGRTSRYHTGGRSHRISHPPPFCCMLALIFTARRIQPFLFFSSSTVKYIEFVYQRINHFPSLVGHFYFYFIFSRGKIPVSVTAPRFEFTPRRQKASRLQTEPWGRATAPRYLKRSIYNCVLSGFQVSLFSLGTVDVASGVLCLVCSLGYPT